MDIKDKIIDSLSKAVKEYGEVEIHLEHPENSEHGDYSTNIAMILAKRIKKNPMELAQDIKEKVESGKWKMENIDKVDVIAPGFINFWLSENFLSRELELALKERDRYGVSNIGNGKKVVVEYSSPNIAKRFGIGHLRSTIIGQTIYNLYQLLGFDVVNDNHIGDWGTQFGAIIYQVLKSKKDVSSLDVDQLEELYVDFNSRAKDDPKLWDEARLWFKKLEDGDSKAKGIWQAAVKISLSEFQKIYDLLGVKFSYMHGESFYEDKMALVISELKEKNLVVEDQGALIIKYPNDELTPGIILKSDGATTYLTRDLAQIKFRLGEWNPDLLIYEVGVEQTLHFRQLFRAIEMLGWANQDKRSLTLRDKFVHIKHGLYLGTNGKKFSTRRGENIRIEDVLDEAIERARKLIKNKPENGDNKINESERKQVAKQVGIGAVKYFDLSHSPESDIAFSWDKVFQLTGNSGPYLQYTHARAQSVLSKANLRVLPQVLPPASARLKAARVSGALPPVSPANLSNEELSLLRTFYRFPEVIESAALDYSPNIICNYLFELASKYNLMYNNLPILNPEISDKQQEIRSFRLKLTQVTANILKTGLGLLGIDAPKKM